MVRRELTFCGKLIRFAENNTVHEWVQTQIKNVSKLNEHIPYAVDSR